MLLRMSYSAFRDDSLASPTLSASSLMARHCSLRESAISVRTLFFSVTVRLRSSKSLDFSCNSFFLEATSFSSLARDFRNEESLVCFSCTSSSFSDLAMLISSIWDRRWVSRSFFVRNCLPRPCLAYRPSMRLRASSRSFVMVVMVSLASSYAGCTTSLKSFSATAISSFTLANSRLFEASTSFPWVNCSSNSRHARSNLVL
mmetsp:Transcript_10746/g.22804  ORF Transcript_10746/g.22804 Transcript_10746/m.22804 type:complete len:202 (-) Transcript_10746:1219-1824(-)